MQPDIKKLITVFLTIAFLSGIFSFSFMQSGFLGGGSSGLAHFATSTSGNAFADISLVTPPWRTQPVLAAKDSFVITSNLTQSYSQVFNKEMSAAAVKDEAVNESTLLAATKNIESKVFETTSIPDSEVKVNENATLEDAAAYMEKIREVGRSVIEDSIPQSFDRSLSNAEQINFVANFFKKKHEEVASLSVPKVMVPVHKAFLSFLIGYQNFYSSLTDEKDPLKTIFVIQNKNQIVDQFTTTLVDVLQKVGPAIKVSYLDHKEDESGIFSLFAPRIAHADVDPLVLAATILQTAFDIANWAKQLAANIGTQIYQAWEKTAWIRDWIQTQLEWAEKKATELLKNVLVQLFVVASISWLNGNGAPQFVTNWRSYAESAASLGINKGFSSISDDACGTFGPSMIQELNGSFNTYYAPENCQMSAFGRALERFRGNSFFDGGWDAYGKAISPEGNYFQSYSDYSARINRSADEEAQAAINKAISSNSFLPTENCPESNVEGPPNPDGSCIDGSEPQITTPGITFKAALEKSVGAPIDRIVNAENLIALSFTLANGVMSKLKSNGSQGLTGLRDTGSMQVTNPNQNINLSDVCSSYASGTPEFASCIGSVGAAGQIQTDLDNQNASTSANEADNQAIQNLKSEAQTIDQNRVTIGISNDQILADIQTLNVRTTNPDTSTGRALLEKVVNTCSNLGFSNPDRARINEAQDTRSDLDVLNGKVVEVNGINRDLMDADLSTLIQSNDTDKIRDLFTKFTTDYGTLASTTQLLVTTANRKAEVGAIKNQAQSTIDNPCHTPIQRVTPTLLLNP